MGKSGKGILALRGVIAIFLEKYNEALDYLIQTKVDEFAIMMILE
jgi:hypothetical protein